MNETVSEGACGARLMCTAGVAISAENGHTPLPNDATSILERRVATRVGVCVCVCVCVCVRVCVCVLHVCPRGVYPGGYNAAPYTASDHSLFGTEHVCVHMRVCERESEGSYAPINIKYRYPCQ